MANLRKVHWEQYVDDHACANPAEDVYEAEDGEYY